MTIKEAIKTTEKFNRWRRGANIEMPNPTEIGIAIDMLIDVAKGNIK